MMTFSRTPLLTLTSLVAFGAGPALMPLGCDGKESKSTTAAETTSGGTTTQATAGGATGSGGEDITLSSGGTAISTTTTLPDIACSSDVECKASSLLCNKSTSKCVQCLQAEDCAASPVGKFCDVAGGKCVACLTATDCPNPATTDCIAQACVPAKTCVNSLGCDSASAPVCNVTTSRCVECLSAADCTANGKVNSVCVANQCQASCTATADCTDGTLCNTAATPAYCVACLTDADCTTGNRCSSGTCITGGISPTCAGNTAKPCAAIPAFTGTQVLDGYADDFCNVPGFVLAFDSTAGKVNRASGEDASATYPEKATFRVAWSTSLVHVHVEVVDPSVNPNKNPADIWNGDSVEFMISTNSNLTGLTSTDANALHVIANSTIGVTVKASGDSGTHTQISDANFFKALTTSQGYAVEVRMPWPGGATVTAGTAIYFDAAINSARLNTTDSTAPRNAQALLFQSPNTTKTSCTGAEVAPFCDDRLWCSTKFQ